MKPPTPASQLPTEDLAKALDRHAMRCRTEGRVQMAYDQEQSAARLRELERRAAEAEGRLEAAWKAGHHAGIDEKLGMSIDSRMHRDLAALASDGLREGEDG